jgi:hypothetical protein
MPENAEAWSLTSLREKLIKIGAKVVSNPEESRLRTRFFPSLVDDTENILPLGVLKDT